MKGSSLLLVLCFIGFINCLFGHRYKPVTSRRKKVSTNPFTSLMCRLRHYKTILNEQKKVVGCRNTCPTNYVERYSFHWGHHCIEINIPKGCADQYCIKCEPGYKWMYTYPYQDRCVKKCPPKYMDNRDTCTLCMVEDCVECSSMWSCTKCEKDFAVIYSTLMGSTVCMKNCPQNYKKVSKNGALNCVQKDASTTATTTTTTTITTTVAKATPPKAKKKPIEVLPEGCKDPKCVNCEKDFYKYYPISKGSHCLKQCPVGHATLGSICVACSDRRCASCKTSLAECDKCFPGYSMLLDSANITMECVQTCPTGYKQQTVDGVSLCLKTTESECPIAHCARCVGQKLQPLHRGCEQCQTEYVLFRGTFNDHCYNECPPQYFESIKPGTNIAACAKCKTAFCKKCTDENTCNECVPPMVLDPLSQQCTTCGPRKEFNFQTNTCIYANMNRPESNESFEGN